MLKDKIGGLRGWLDIEMIDTTTGEVTLKRRVDNLVVTAGIGLFTDRMLTSPTGGPITHMGLGTSSQAPAAGDTGLITAHGDGRVALTSTNRTLTSVANDTLVYAATFAAGNSTNASLQEAGLFTASTGPTMLCRTLTGTINKGAADSLTITWNVQLAAA